MLGKLRSMSLGIPGSKGLFSLLQTGITCSKANRMHLTSTTKAHLQDFEHLAHDLRQCHASITELVPDKPIVLGQWMPLGKEWAVLCHHPQHS